MSNILDAFTIIPENPAPAGLEAGYLDLGGRHRLRYAIGRGSAEMTSRGTVVLLQGRNEAAEKYFETIADLNARGFTVATFDWRGQGGSGRLSPFTEVGHIARVKTFVDDLDRFVRTVVLDRCPAPYAVLAHSMGGLVALAANERLLSAGVERMVLSAPLVALPGSAARHRLLHAASNLLHWIGLGHLPLRRVSRFGRGTTLAGNALTSDRARFERNRALHEAAPGLFVRGLSASWLRAVMRAARRLDHSDVIAALRLPTLIVTAGDDRVVSTTAAERLAWRMRSGHFLRVPGARHELLQEADRYREPFLAAFESFVEAALPKPPTLPPLDEALIESALVQSSEPQPVATR